ncbi:MAG: sulfur carrier protein ThiS adenylyltransferase ThiF [Pseudomonadota bacterium]
MITSWTDERRTLLANARVGIAGAGGLGSTCALALARAGVGGLVLVDFDVVERSNLNRQAYTLAQVGRPKLHALAENINACAPECRLRLLERRYEAGMAAELFAGCQVVVEAFDTPEAKVALLEDLLEHLPQVPVVAGSGIAGIGGNNALDTRRFGRLYVVGDGATAAGPGVPLLGPRVMAAACLQANQALALLLGDTDV